MGTAETDSGPPFAASVASLLITTEAIIAEKPKDKPAGGMPGGGGMGGMDF